MPTTRTYVLLATSFLLYLFANQTQVGWLYVMSALLAGLVLAAWWMNRKMLPGLAVQRTLADGHSEIDLYEGDAVSVRLVVRNAAAQAAYQIRAIERCPLAPQDAQRISLFAPIVPGGDRVQLEYEVACDRRGLHTFPALETTTRSPFGLFHRRRTVVAPTQVLVYPEVRPFERLRLLDQRSAPQLVRPRAGVGSEVIGVRPYRPGDMPRHIHWRTVARTRELATKEFADESQAGLTIVLDLHQNGADLGAGKHTTFEWAVKIAASLGDYAYRRGYPVEVAVECEAWPAPRGQLSRFALLQYLARVQAEGDTPVADVLAGLRVATSVAAVLPWPDREALTGLRSLQRDGVGVLAVVLDPSEFLGMGGQYADDAQRLTGELLAAGIDAYLVGWGDVWVEALTPHPSLPRSGRGGERG